MKRWISLCLLCASRLRRRQTFRLNWCGVAKVATPYGPHLALARFRIQQSDRLKFSLVDADSQAFLGVERWSVRDARHVGRATEPYVGETYYSHGSRGTRADLVTVYDMATLGVVAEIEDPDQARQLGGEQSRCEPYGRAALSCST
jgi:hypothetical protein